MGDRLKDDDVPRPDSITFVGQLPDDPDHMPLAPPEGFIWMLGGAWSSSYETFGVADVRVQHGGQTLNFVMSLADVQSLKALCQQVIEAMHEAGADA